MEYQRRGFIRRLLLSKWTLLGVLWSGCWVAYGKYNTETVPLTGRSRYAGVAARTIPVDGKAMIDEVELQALSLSLEDPRYKRVRGILDRLLASAGLESSRWRLVITRREGKLARK
jgi:hypothetical protein